MTRVLVPLSPEELVDGQMRGVQVEKRALLVARVADRHFAIDDWCNHGGCLLSGGRLEEGIVICPCHEVGFDVTTGRLATQPILCEDQQTFPVEIRDGQVFVELPDQVGGGT